MRMPLLSALALVAGCARAPRAPERLAEEFVSRGSPAPSVHASTVIEHGGRILVAWFAGSYESAEDVSILLSAHAPASGDTSRWTTPVEIATGLQRDGERFPTWNPVLFAPDSATVQLYYKVGPNPREWWGAVRTSTDGGRTWSDETRLPDGVLGPIKNKPVRLATGVIVSASSTEAPDSANAWRVHFERSTDDGRSWTIVRPDAPSGDSEFDAIQPAILMHRDGRLQALARTRGPGRIAESWSRDEGRTWTPLTLIDLPNPNSGLDALTLRDGRHLLVYNHTPEGRTPLNLAISDDGKHWTPLMTLESEPGEYSYPALIQASDGTVHLTWTWKRERIKHVALRIPQ